MNQASVDHHRSLASWILAPAVVMSLGWGLRGYIGGGPFGAMIPGALVALLLCQYLRWSAASSAVVVAFSALGIGFGGEMTYGQTLGLLLTNDSFAWGLTGTTLKGGVWGLLGGAMLGLGFVARSTSWRQLGLTLGVLLAGIMVGLHYVNEPKLIYFSNPIDRPRDESWAGFLLGAIAALAFLRIAAPTLVAVPLRFAGYAAIGGAIGFGGGSLLLALQSRVADAWRWMPYWKYMEFTFGFLFGAALGLAAYHSRDRLGALEPRASQPAVARRPATSALASILTGALVVYGVFRIWPLVENELAEALAEFSLGGWERTFPRVVLGFAGLGCLLMLLARRSQTVAWHTAIGVTIVAAAIDWQGDLLTHAKIDMPANARLAFVLAMAAVSILLVAHWQGAREPRLTRLYVFALVMLMTIGYMMGLADAEIWWGDGPAGGYWHRFRGEIVVHAIFTAQFLICLSLAWRERNPPISERGKP
jgi:hypothetical protein